MKTTMMDDGPVKKGGTIFKPQGSLNFVKGVSLKEGGA